MMGERQVLQEGLFYAFSIEQHVPADHLLRSIDRFVDLSSIRRHLAPHYSATGRPSVDPELMLRMLIIGYCFGIRSERRLCEEVHLNLAYRWFCRLGLEDRVPHHSTFSKNRHGRFRDSGLFREVFNQVLKRCMAEGLVGGEAFAADASVIQADANRQKGDAGSLGLPDDLTSRAVNEYLATLDDEAFGAASDVTPKYLSPTDPGARWTAAHPRGKAFYAYSLNYLIDCKNAIIVDVEGSSAIRQGEMAATRRMIERAKDDQGLWPERLAADTAYGSAEMLGWLVYEHGIEPHIPVFDKSARQDGSFEKADFIYDSEKDAYVCPAGKLLKPRQKVYRTHRPLVDQDGMMRYRASKSDCDNCALKPRCCPKAPARKIPRSIYEGARDMAHHIVKSPDYEVSRRERKKVEMLFAHLRRIMRFDRLRLRGPTGINDEFLLAAIAQNLRKMAKLAGPAVSTRPT
ncbi:MAG: IS1182 family transposase [Hyphomicrobiales bacterium]|jgi:transposase